MNNSNWKSDSFRRTGLRHLDKSQPCQDYVLTDKIGKDSDSDDLFILCDGISSCADSDQGSKLTAEGTRDYFKRKYAAKGFFKQLFEAPDAGLKTISKELIAEIKELLAECPKADTTLTFVWLINSRYALTGCIGDSAVCIFSENKAVVLTQSNDYGGATESVRNSRAAELITLRLIDMKADKVSGFLLTSDGLEGILYTKGKRTRALHTCQDCVNTLFEEDGHEQVELFLKEVCADGSFDDDISLIIVAREPISLPEDPTWLCSCGTHNHLFSTRCAKCGTDYFLLYGKADMRSYPSAWEYFQYLNSHPDEEQKTVEAHKTTDKKHAKVNHGNLPDYGSFDSKPDYDVVDFVEYRDSNSEPCTDSEDMSVDHEQRTSDNPRRSSSPDTGGAHLHKSSAVMFPKRFAIIGSSVAVLLCGVLIVNFFQMLSISNTLREMRVEIDSIKDAKTVNVMTTAAEKASKHTHIPTIKATESVPIQSPTQKPTQPSAEVTPKTKLSISEVVALYPEPNYQYDAVGNAAPDSEIVLLERQVVDNVQWVRIELGSGESGWAPSEFFSPTEDQDSSTQAEDSTESTESQR